MIVVELPIGQCYNVNNYSYIYTMYQQSTRLSDHPAIQYHTLRISETI